MYFFLIFYFWTFIPMLIGIPTLYKLYRLASNWMWKGDVRVVTRTKQAIKTKYYIWFGLLCVLWMLIRTYKMFEKCFIFRVLLCFLIPLFCLQRTKQMDHDDNKGLAQCFHASTTSISVLQETDEILDLWAFPIEKTNATVASYLIVPTFMASRNISVCIHVVHLM